MESQQASSSVQWSDYFYYDETSVTCLRWKVEIRSGFGNANVLAEAGDVAGCATGWRSQVGLHGKLYQVARVIWEMHHGALGEFHVDHINGNELDNHLCNLRAVTNTTNRRNQKLDRRSTSGLAGVSLKAGKGWTAMWTDENGKRKQRYFSTKKYGEHAAKELATAHRAEMIEALNQAGAGYTDRHGT